MHGLFKTTQLNRLQEMIPGFSISHHLHDTNQKVKGRFTDIHFDEHITIEYGNVSEKQNRYGEILTAMMQDQWNWINNRNHKRIIDDANAIESLRMAEQATQMALKF